MQAVILIPFSQHKVLFLAPIGMRQHNARRHPHTFMRHILEIRRAHVPQHDFQLATPPQQEGLHLLGRLVLIVLAQITVTAGHANLPRHAGDFHIHNLLQLSLALPVHPRGGQQGAGILRRRLGGQHHLQLRKLLDHTGHHRLPVHRGPGLGDLDALQPFAALGVFQRLKGFPQPLLLLKTVTQLVLGLEPLTHVILFQLAEHQVGQPGNGAQPPGLDPVRIARQPQEKFHRKGLAQNGLPEKGGTRLVPPLLEQKRHDLAQRGHFQARQKGHQLVQRAGLIHGGQELEKRLHEAGRKILQDVQHQFIIRKAGLGMGLNRDHFRRNLQLARQHVGPRQQSGLSPSRALDNKGQPVGQDRPGGFGKAFQRAGIGHQLVHLAKHHRHVPLGGKGAKPVVIQRERLLEQADGLRPLGRDIHQGIILQRLARGIPKPLPVAIRHHGRGQRLLQLGYGHRPETAQSRPHHFPGRLRHLAAQGLRIAVLLGQQMIFPKQIQAFSGISQGHLMARLFVEINFHPGIEVVHGAEHAKTPLLFVHQHPRLEGQQDLKAPQTLRGRHSAVKAQVFHPLLLRMAFQKAQQDFPNLRGR